MRVLIDASVLIRALLFSPNPARAVVVIVQAAVAGAFGLLLPPELLAEVADKTRNDPYLAPRIDPAQATEFEELLRRTGLLLPPFAAPFPPLTRDPDDDYLLAYALRDGADYLVTADRDLLDLAADYPAPRIVDAGGFVRALRAAGRL